MLGIDVPVELRNGIRTGSGDITGEATYGRFRRFQVDAED